MQIGNREFNLKNNTYIMGILNITHSRTAAAIIPWRRHYGGQDG